MEPTSRSSLGGAPPARRVVLLEINEITWDLVDPLIEAGKLPHLAALRQEGAWGSPVAPEQHPFLDPWVTWTTVHTGRPQSEHHVQFLEQPPESIGAPRTWEILAARGRSVGVYGSLCSWPPRAVTGFHVPDTFAPDDATHPASLRPIQQLNLSQTRSVRVAGAGTGRADRLLLPFRLIRLGVSPRSVLAMARQLAAERRDPGCRWRRVALQPIVNLDVFERLWRRQRPDFATFHTNHVAHFQHTYWNSMEPERFPNPPPPADVERYGGAIELGYRVADDLIGRVRAMADAHTTVVIASSMGQQPYLDPDGRRKRIMQVRSLERLLEVAGLAGRATALATMSDEFVVTAQTDADMDDICRVLGDAHLDRPDQPLFHLKRQGGSVAVNIRTHHPVTDTSVCHFPGGAETAVPLATLIMDTGHWKAGWHHPCGVLVLHGAGVRAGEVGPCSTLDLAPTLLALLGEAPTGEMTGRVIAEALA